jgi:hypothetical protein
MLRVGVALAPVGVRAKRVALLFADQCDDTASRLCRALEPL